MVVELRRATAADAALLAAIHDDDRDDLRDAGSDEQTTGRLLRLQHEAQERAWSARWADLRRFLVVLDELVVGRLYLDDGPEALRVVDLTILGVHRGHGTGTAVLGVVRARAGARPVRLNVRRNNPARHLYERLGFVATGTTSTHVSMAWWPDDDQANVAT